MPNPVRPSAEIIPDVTVCPKPIHFNPPLGLSPAGVTIAAGGRGFRRPPRRRSTSCSRSPHPARALALRDRVRLEQVGCIRAYALRA